MHRAVEGWRGFVMVGERWGGQHGLCRAGKVFTGLWRRKGRSLCHVSHISGGGHPPNCTAIAMTESADASTGGAKGQKQHSCAEEVSLTYPKYFAPVAWDR